jgi:cytochrome c oxidase cbb3-type subunit 1
MSIAVGREVDSSLKYDYAIVRFCVIAAFFWLVTGLSFGLLLGLQLSFPAFNFDIPWLTFGRLRPVHTNAAVLGFGGNALLATSFYVVQRTCQARLALSKLARFVVIGYQIFLVMALSQYMMGYTQSKEYAEAEWHACLWLTIVWVCYFLVFAQTIAKRKEKHIYVANWFYLAFIIVVAVLHIGNNLAIPLSLTSVESVPAFSGVQAAMIQWWYGHNVVGFFLTTGFIGIMYYFVPKRANRPIYSYRLSIMHFWALIFLYIWAGPHHLHYTALPDWTQTLGMTMSLMLWLPSWGGMVNGIMTLSGAWHKLREDPVLQFLIIAVAFYGMSTFEGPVMAIKEVNALSHYTEWTISHVHSGVLGWVGFISFGALYHMVPILWRRQGLYSMKLVSVHLWLASIGIVLYITSMWAAGITQGLMWRSYDEMGFLKYAFIDIVSVLHPYYVIRAIGGIFYLSGAILMIYNLTRTILGHKREEALTDSNIDLQLETTKVISSN